MLGSRLAFIFLSFSFSFLPWHQMTAANAASIIHEVISGIYPCSYTSLPRLSLQVATKTLPFYKDYFDVPYPLPKIDLIAIADFAAGEWG